MTLKTVTGLSFVLAMAMLRCGIAPTAGKGGSSETVNAKVAVTDTLVSVTFDEGVDEALTLHAFAADYRPYEQRGYADSISGNAAAALRWNAPSSGKYNFLLRLLPAGKVCFIGGVELAAGVNASIPCFLGAPCTLTGSLATSDSSIVTESYVLSIYGSPFFGLSDRSGGFTIGSVPEGHYTLSVRPATIRLFAPISNYAIATEALDASTRLRVMIP